MNCNKKGINLFNFAKKIIIENIENDDLLYEYVLAEIENEIIIKGLWAKAIAMAEGNEKKIEPLYMQYRVQNIKDQFTKLNIAYSDMKKEVLFNKIKSIFNPTHSVEQITPAVTVKIVENKKSVKGHNEAKKIQKATDSKNEDNFEDYAERRSREINEALKQYKK